MQFASFMDETVLFGSTTVENEFIVEYMPQAPGEFVRVYLYMLFKCHHPSPGDSLEGIARELGLGEEDILRAMSYWERQGLWRKVGDNPPRFQFVGCYHRTMDEIPRQNRELHAQLQALFGMDYVIQPRDFTTIADWQEVYGLPADVILLLTEGEIAKTHAKRRSMNSIFKRLDKTAQEWAKAGVFTVETAKEYVARTGAGYEAACLVLRQFNLRREPTVDEIALANGWVHAMQLSNDDILAACAETVSSRNPTFAYLDAILKRHSGSGKVSADIQADRQRVDALKEICAELGLPTAQIPPAQIETYAGYERMGFEKEALIEAARRCAREGMQDFAAWEKYVGQCAQKGLFTLEALKRNTRRMDQLSEAAERVMRTYGDDRHARAADREWIEKWLAVMPMEVILLAAERSQGTQLPRKYITRLLTNWQKNGITTLEAAMQENAPQTAGTAAKTAAEKSYTQREYRDEDYADDTMMKMWMDGGTNDASGNH